MVQENLIGQSPCHGPPCGNSDMGEPKVIAVIVRIEEVEDAVLFKLRWFTTIK
jgi:hypothetical protein